MERNQSRSARPLAIPSLVCTSLLLFTLAAIPHVYANPALLDATGSISGTVYRPDGITTIANADVYANGYDGGGGNGYARTDALGKYTITGLPPGDYRVEAAAGSQGYVREYYKETAGYGQAARVSVAAGQTTTGIDFTLDASGGISGKVAKADGVTAIANADVYANSYDGGGGNGYARTDALGKYTITGLPPGDYRVEAAAGSQGYVREYYKETVGYGQAARVSVAAGQTTTGIDFTLDVGGGIGGVVSKVDTPTPTPTFTPTPTPTPTATPMPTAIPTATPTATPMPTAIPTATPTSMPASEPSATSPSTTTPLPTPTATPTPILTVTPAPTSTPTVMPAPTTTPTATPTATQPGTVLVMPTPSAPPAQTNSPVTTPTSANMTPTSLAPPAPTDTPAPTGDTVTATPTTSATPVSPPPPGKFPTRVIIVLMLVAIAGGAGYVLVLRQPSSPLP